MIVRRTNAPPTSTLTQKEAVLDALGGLGVPIVADVECGHVPPYMPIGQRRPRPRRRHRDHAEITQTLS